MSESFFYKKAKQMFEGKKSQGRIVRLSLGEKDSVPFSKYYKTDQVFKPAMSPFNIWIHLWWSSMFLNFTFQHDFRGLFLSWFSCSFEYFEPWYSDNNVLEKSIPSLVVNRVEFFYTRQLDFSSEPGVTRLSKNQLFWKKKSYLRLGSCLVFGQNLRLKARQPSCL